MKQCRAIGRLLVSAVVVVAVSASARAEAVAEKWRSPLGLPRAIAMAGLARTDGFTSPSSRCIIARAPPAVSAARAFALPL